MYICHICHFYIYLNIHPLGDKFESKIFSTKNAIMSQPHCYFIIQNDEISGSSIISNDNLGAINNLKKLNARDSLNVMGLCPIFMFRLKTQAQCPSFMCWKKLLRFSV